MGGNSMLVNPLPFSDDFQVGFSACTAKEWILRMGSLIRKRRVFHSGRLGSGRLSSRRALLEVAEANSSRLIPLSSATNSAVYRQKAG
jgi:type II secretory pathway predicted ATPase ExeA